jgi:hypothetical protein
VLYELGAAIYFTRVGAGAVFLKSKWAVLSHLPSLLQKRKEIQRRRTAGNAQLQEKLRNSIFGIKWRKLRSTWEGSDKKNEHGVTL